jgi:tetratricopeptide (TPR) repeat protein
VCLYILSKDKLLLREQEFDKLDEIFRGHKDTEQNSIVAIIGVGGSGKTTVARTYGKRNASSIVWELNAQSKDSLETSFERLASALGDLSETNQQEYERIVKDFKGQERFSKLLNFVRNHFKQHAGWVLIYDDLKVDYGELHPYLFSNWETCGKGKILITTRNANIKLILPHKNTVDVSRLNDEEKRILFQKINEGHMEEIISKEKFHSILNSLPPFPLDVAVAAYYMKKGPFVVHDYIKSGEESMSRLTKAHQDILKLAGDYQETRHKILSGAVQDLLEIRQEFKELLFLLALSNFKDIPIAPLVERYGQEIIDDFITNLTKHSFITNLSSKGDVDLFSIHESVQAFLLPFLQKKYEDQLCSKDNVFEFFKHVLEEKPTITRGTDFFPLVKVFLVHCEALLKHEHLFKTEQIIWLKTFMGLRYQNLGLFQKSKDILLEALKESGGIKDPILLLDLHRILGSLYVFLGKGVEAKQHLLKGLSIIKSYNINNDYEKGNFLIFMGDACRSEGEYDQAVLYGEEAVRTLASKEHTRAWAKGYLGFFYNNTEQYEEAEKVLKESKDLYRSLKDDYKIAWVGMHLGYTYLFTGKYQEAHELLKESYLLYVSLHGKSHINTAWIESLLGLSYGFLKDFDQAYFYLREAYKVFKDHFGEESFETGCILQYRGIVAFLEVNLKDSKEFLNMSIKIFMKKHPLKMKTSMEYLNKIKNKNTL